MDCISIKNLEVFSKHGVFEEENRLGQKFAIDALLYLDTRGAGVSDDIDQSVDYGKVCHFMTAFMKGHTYKLIETAAERMAEDILIEFPMIISMQLTVKKPWAPIGLPLEEVSVVIKRGWHRAFLSLGANMGFKEDNILQAIEYFKDNDKMRVIKESSLIETEPYGNESLDKFINCAVEIMTLLTPSELLTYCKNLERMAGREEDSHWGPRPLDIDIIFYDDATVDLPELTVPHEDMENRIFVLEPLNEIAPYMRHPVTKLTVKQMLAALRDEV